MISKSSHGGSKPTKVTSRLLTPKLQMLKTFSASSSGQTSPKSSDPVTPMSGGGQLPLTSNSIVGSSGSSVEIRNVAVFAPKLEGAKRMGTSTCASWLRTIGNGGAPGTVPIV